MTRVILLISFLFLCNVCSTSTVENEIVPKHIKKLKKLTIYQMDTKPALDIRLVREQTFGSSDEVLIGQVVDIAVDASERVLIADWDHKTIHLLSKDGKYLTNLGGEGKGPGEFQYLSSARVIKNQLYVVDKILERATIFSLDSLSYSHIINLHPRNKDNFEEIAKLQTRQYFIKTDSTFLISFQPMLVQFPDHPRYNLEDISKRSIHFHSILPGGILSDEVLEQDGGQILSTTINGEFIFTFPLHLSFADYPLISISGDNRLFSARRKEFLIKVYAPDGNYLYSFYYPYHICPKRLKNSQ